MVCREGGGEERGSRHCGTEWGGGEGGVKREMADIERHGVKK